MIVIRSTGRLQENVSIQSTEYVRKTAFLSASLALLIGFGIGATSVGSNPASSTATTTDTLGLAQAELAVCQIELSTATNADETKRAQDCITDKNRVIAFLSQTPSPSPSVTGTPTPTATTPSPTPSASTTTTPTPPPTPTPTGTPLPVTHGSQINQSNTGYLAWVGPQGQRCTNTTLRVYTTKVDASTLGPQATCVWLQKGLNVNAPITLTAARVDAEILTPNGSGHHLNVNWSTITATNADFAIGDHDFDVYRSQLSGASDGVRFDNTNLVEDFITVRQTSSADHNDGIQAYIAGAGGSIIRCNINGHPLNASSGVFGNAAIFLADNSRGSTQIRDNYLAGGGYTLRLHESMFYQVTGNILVAGSWGFGPVTTTNAVPGAFQEWSNNRDTNNKVINLP